MSIPLKEEGRWGRGVCQGPAIRKASANLLTSYRTFTILSQYLNLPFPTALGSAPTCSSSNDHAFPFPFGSFFLGSTRMEEEMPSPSNRKMGSFDLFTGAESRRGSYVAM